MDPTSKIYISPLSGAMILEVKYPERDLLISLNGKVVETYPLNILVLDTKENKLVFLPTTDIIVI